MINVFVTGAGGGAIGEQIIKALRSGKNDYFIVGSDTKANTIARSISDIFVLMPKAGESGYINTLLTYCNKYGIDILFPGSEPELRTIVKNKRLFDEANIHVPINDASLIRLCQDKVGFNEFLVNNEFSYCETFNLIDANSLSRLDNYPYVIKPVSGSGSSNVFIVQDQIELEGITRYLGSTQGFIIQKYVGNINEEYTVGILSTPNHGYVNHIILKRDLSLGMSIKQKVLNRTEDQSLGNTLGISTGISQGKFVSNTLISKTVAKLVELLKPTSTINMQCRVWNEKVYIFEINPRFSGTTNLRALVGFNEPELLVNSLLFEEVPLANESCWINRTVLRGLMEYDLGN
ncbi:MAG: ATP-grasp domain-containing protein [Cyclobacteriaceae bacterium]